MLPHMIRGSTRLQRCKSLPCEGPPETSKTEKRAQFRHSRCGGFGFLLPSLAHGLTCARDPLRGIGQPCAPAGRVIDVCRCVAVRSGQGAKSAPSNVGDGLPRITQTVQDGFKHFSIGVNLFVGITWLQIQGIISNHELSKRGINFRSVFHAAIQRSDVDPRCTNIQEGSSSHWRCHDLVHWCM